MQRNQGLDIIGRMQGLDIIGRMQGLDIIGRMQRNQGPDSVLDGWIVITGSHAKRKG